ncbi:4-hydroxy-tetrahydrodipicolinate reductase [Enhydrobacter sp.]|jgi:4-hydroxy-tetrahydrodipicolinate reductase|uniref:4-hydroxy-tetrahydrodipicolinate reductase n=1 Tax=Enhydrobacter sp. TaxID=1894999 RepID=UPI0026280CE3|nr:4-hydroxy-tetrahydrodipicolinate reductase [Enhydrobacter sp.]WIM10980.1 MAG: 4-hydroxy-tetrahydrodipicolinate reductase [Enhydrobacter sp.]
MKVAIVGAAGRMGQMLIREIARTEGCSLAGASEAAGSKAIGRDAGELAGVAATGVKITADSAAAIGAAEVVIDFTVPAAAVAHAGIAADKGVSMVIGTTGLDARQTAAVHDCARRIPILWAANMSMGINILMALVEKTASLLDPGYDIEVLEMHHRHKIDAPSGTALALGRAAAAGRKVRLEDVWRKSRDGHTGARPAGEIGFATLRGGEEVGVHTVMFAAAGERLELSHRAFSRETYASGAVRSALWLTGKKPGLYGMKDVLGL